MKKALAISLLAMFAAGGYAQSIPLYSLNFDNRFIQNPARAGFNGNPELYLVYRKQWVDFNGAPETRAASFDMAVGKGGFGFFIYNDISNIFKTWGGNFSYAYHLKFKEDAHRLSIGLSAGIQDNNFDREKAFNSGVQSDDPLLQGERGLSFDGSAGVNYLFTKGSLVNLSVGIAAQSLFATDLRFLNDESSSTLIKPGRSFHAILSNRFKFVDEKVILEPMFITRFTEALNYQIEPGLLVGYKDWVWVSGMYRYDFGMTIAGGFKVHNAVKIGYAYDLPMNDIKDYTTGSHEVMLGIVFGKKKDDAIEKEIAELKKKMMDQDSLFLQQDSLLQELRDNQDSLINQIDEMNYKMEDLQYKIDSMEVSTGYEFDEETMTELMKSGGVEGAAGLSREIQQMRKEMDELKQMKQELEESVRQTKTKVKDMQTDLVQERTRIVEGDDLTVKRGPALGDYFMVVGSFRIEQNSYNFQEDLKKRGYDAGVVFDQKRKWYYVYIAQPKELKKGLEDLYKLREENPEFHDAWIHIMRKSLR